jgi:phosphoribosyl 1,2-cyclic phosphate phosphodiesterase
MKITILGCGASAGVPFIGCECAVCTSDNPKNKRTRVSILVETETTRILIDASPDLRQQALDNHFKTVDAIILTHFHADHVHGIDDIRSLNFHRNDVIPLYSDAETLKRMEHSFSYIFREPPKDKHWFRPAVTPVEIAPLEPFIIGDISLQPFWQDHGFVPSLGFRIGDFAYSTDVKDFPVESQPYLKGLKLWLLDCLTDERPMPTHADLNLSLEWIEKYQPKHTILTHMSHALDYDKVNAQTPEHVEAAYDGMMVEI